MDKEVFFLYRFSGIEHEIKCEYQVDKFKSRWFKSSFDHMIKGEKTKDYNDLYTELRWRIASNNKLDIFYIVADGMIAHTSLCTPKSFKFPFMKKNDYFIGPCFTDSHFRGKSIYPYVLNYIAKDLKKNASTGDIYGIVSINNPASRSGILKAGFKEVATLEKRGWLKKYYITKWL